MKLVARELPRLNYHTKRSKRDDEKTNTKKKKAIFWRDKNRQKQIATRISKKKRNNMISR